MEILNTLEKQVQNAIQKINALQSRVDELENENAEYKQRLEAINAQLSSIDTTISTTYPEQSDNGAYAGDELDSSSAGYGAAY